MAGYNNPGNVLCWTHLHDRGCAASTCELVAIIEYTILEYTILEYTILEYTILEYTILEYTVLE